MRGHYFFKPKRKVAKIEIRALCQAQLLSSLLIMPAGPIRRQHLSSGQKKRNYDDKRNANSPHKIHANELAISSFEFHGLGTTHRAVRVIIQETCELVTVNMLLERDGAFIKEIIIVERNLWYTNNLRKKIANCGLADRVKVVCDDMINYLSKLDAHADYIWFDGQSTKVTPEEIRRMARTISSSQCFALTLTNRGRVPGGGLNARRRIGPVSRMITQLIGHKTLDHGYKSSMNMILLAFGRTQMPCRYRVGTVKPHSTKRGHSIVRPFGYGKSLSFTINESPEALKARGWFTI